jgi:hypothetical protein
MNRKPFQRGESGNQNCKTKYNKTKYNKTKCRMRASNGGSRASGIFTDYFWGVASAFFSASAGWGRTASAVP